MEYTRESIFVSSVRAFCRSFAAIVGVLVGVVLVCVALMMFSAPDLYPSKSSMQIAPDAMGDRELLPATAPVVLKLNIMGVVGMEDLTTEKIQDTLLDSREGMLVHDRVKAIFLHIATPGGTVDDAHGIYQALMDYKHKYKVPIVAFVDGLCASGGMYIASAADKIYATSNSIIGSVGVILGPTFNFSGLMDRYGVQALTITQGKDKDALNPFRPWVPGEDASIRTITSDLYQQFVSIVTAARPRLSREKLINEYGANIFIAQTAMQYGYIDEANADYAMAMSGLAQMAQLTDQGPYQVFQMQPARPFFADLAQGRSPLLSGKVTHQFQLSSALNSELSGKWLYLYQPM